MHPAAYDWCVGVRERYPAHFGPQASVLEIGSLNINGGVRELFDPACRYIGIDVIEGPGVDVVYPAGAADWLMKNYLFFTTVISTEALEHDPHWRMTIKVAVRTLTPKGLICFTCATTGRHEHGTITHSPKDAPGSGDYYLNLTEQHVRSALPNLNDVFARYEFNVLGEDLRFYGIKK